MLCKREELFQGLPFKGDLTKEPIFETNALIHFAITMIVVILGQIFWISHIVDG